MGGMSSGCVDGRMMAELVSWLGGCLSVSASHIAPILLAAYACQHALSFHILDVSTSGCLPVQVCRAAGYFQHALFVCQAAAETQWYLDILLEDMQSWEDALAYLQDLPRQQAAAAHTAATTLA